MIQKARPRPSTNKTINKYVFNYKERFAEGT